MNASERRSERVAVSLTPEEVKRIDDWGFSRRLRARSEVIRELLRRQLEQPGAGPKRPHHG